MKEFINVLRRFVPPYKKYLVLSVVFNILSAVLNIFSFAALIPILQILFQTSDAETATAVMAWDWANIQKVLMNNMNYYVKDNDAASHRHLPRRHHLPQDWSLFPLCRHHHPHPHRCGARYPQPSLSEDYRPATRLLLRGAQGRHHCPHERRRAGDRELHHGLARDAVQEPHPHRQLLRCPDLHLLGTHPLHPHHRAHHGLVHGLGRP